MSYIMIVINLLGTLITPILGNIVTITHRYRKNKRTGNFTQMLENIQIMNNDKTSKRNRN